MLRDKAVQASKEAYEDVQERQRERYAKAHEKDAGNATEIKFLNARKISHGNCRDRITWYCTGLEIQAL